MTAWRYVKTPRLGLDTPALKIMVKKKKKAQSAFVLPKKVHSFTKPLHSPKNIKFLGGIAYTHFANEKGSWENVKIVRKSSFLFKMSLVVSYNCIICELQEKTINLVMSSKASRGSVMTKN